MNARNDNTAAKRLRRWWLTPRGTRLAPGGNLSLVSRSDPAVAAANKGQRRQRL